MPKSNFDELMKKYLTGQVSEVEKDKIEAWLDVVKVDHKADVNLSKEDEEKLFQKIINNKNSVSEIRNLHTPAKDITLLGWTLRITASIFLVAVVSFLIWNNRNLFGTSEDVDKLILNDGSLVWLKGDSKLAYYNKESEGIRYTELEGEALFEVAKDPDHPFVIQCGDATLKVLGTSFSLKSLHDTLQLTVLTGKVNVSVPNQNILIDVSANEKIIYTGRTAITRTSFSESEVSKVIANTEYNMHFSQATLEHVLDRLEDKFDVVVKLEGREIGNCRLTIDLTDRSLENSLHMISEVLDIKYLQEGKVITVGGTGCN